MRLLVLGGTEFVGRAVVQEALARDEDVTVLNRGRHEPIPGAEAMVGDRRTPAGLAALAGREWDAVIDTWSAEPYVVRDAVAALAGRAGRYLYVSSRSVHQWPGPAGMAEDGPVVDGSPDAGADGEPVEYGQAKRGGELAVEAGFGDRSVLARAGLILGPYENIGRLPWWLRRVARGGRVLAPGPRDLPLQYIDARDLAAWLVDAAASDVSGPYNLVSPAGHSTMEETLTACVRVTGSDAELVWTDPEVILAAGIEPWTELPIWLPPGEGYDFLHQGDVSRALATGLRCRPMPDTVADTWAWLRSIGGEAPQRPDRPGVGLDPAKEAEILGV